MIVNPRSGASSRRVGRLARIATMTSWRAVAALPSLILLAGTAQCGSTSDAPPAQLLLWVDTDAPAAALALVQQGDGGADDNLAHDPHLLDSAVDTLRIDVLKPDNTTADLREISAPDEANWPISFGLPSQPGVNVVRLRLRAFRAQRAQLGPSPIDPEAQVFEPVPAYAIDRVVELPMPSEKGAFAFRVVLHSACRGKRSNFVQAHTCIDAEHAEAGYREGIEFVSTGQRPSREPMWWPASSQDTCEPGPCTNGKCCIPGGFFMLGNTRVVGFGSLRRHDAVPAHPVQMKAFWMDELEVTVDRWVSEGLPTPSYLPASDPSCTWAMSPDGMSIVPNGAFPPDTPVNCVTWDDAASACNKLGGRLPTEAEWEYVATGRGRGNLFPWGDSPPHCSTSALGRFDPIGIAQCAPDPGDPSVIGVPGAHPSDETDGVMDMAGSVSEWMLDTFLEYDQDPAAGNTPCWRRDGLLSHPACLAVGTTKSVRGGSFASPMEVSYAALRNSEEQSTAAPPIGFRCVYPIGVDPVSQPPADIPGEPERTDGGAP